jgi:hypothetical protein
MVVRWRRALFAAPILPISFLRYSYTQKAEAMRSSETSVDSYRIPRCYNPRRIVCIRRRHRCENLIANTVMLMFSFWQELIYVPVVTTLKLVDITSGFRTVAAMFVVVAVLTFFYTEYQISHS